ncbi:Na(+)/H(+) antiporter subunit D [Candidatus Desulfarcum epimagneticum]|uniref:Na(+)/H(+) antiporter subunit D n=1 Tax=uncultured Desulfobacteraceae bacterium TaxID=218296 RepID=A0A484HL14_9BACT|nr:Na(+)/H(+) antiporter subunit D [uncultured Desulfobacteraceae bacterium]
MNDTLFHQGFPPALIFIAGAMLTPLLRGKARSAFMLLIPALSFMIIAQIPEGAHWNVSFLGYDLVPGRIDRLSRVFGLIFTLISFIAVIFSMKVNDKLQHVAGLCYAGSALGVTFAGDFLTLYIFWEIMAISSTFLVLASRTDPARKAAFRYILVHIFGGLCLLAGILTRIHETGSIQFAYMDLSGMSAWLIFIGIAVNAAIPPIHPWLKDAYPESTVTGAVFLSAFTTKSAVYVMARMFPGAEILIWLGAVMTILPVFYAEIENDIRRVLSYSLMNQVGFMMCGIGIGTQLAINGAVSHAFCHILYKALLFMAAGSVLHMTGKIKCTDIGGLHKTMPVTCLFCVIGAASISAFPLFSGFVSKSMIISAAGNNHLTLIWLMLQFASAGVIAHAGIKVPFFTFFGHDSGIRAKEPPLNMMIAMGIAAFLCVFIGVFPQFLYHILPYPVDYVPYTSSHVVAQLQLLMFGIFAFYLLLKSGYYPSEIRAVNLDTDWFYRKGAALVVGAATAVSSGIAGSLEKIFILRVPQKAAGLFKRPMTRLLSLLTGEKDDPGKNFHDTATLTPAGMPVMAALVLLGALGALFMFIG